MASHLWNLRGDLDWVLLHFVSTSAALARDCVASRGDGRIPALRPGLDRVALQHRCAIRFRRCGSAFFSTSRRDRNSSDAAGQILAALLSVARVGFVLPGFRRHRRGHTAGLFMVHGRGRALRGFLRLSLHSCSRTGIQRLQSRPRSRARDAHGNAGRGWVRRSLSDALDHHLQKGKALSPRLDAYKKSFPAGFALGRSDPAKSGDRLVVALPGNAGHHSHSRRTRCVPAAFDRQKNGGRCDRNIKQRARICRQPGTNNARRLRPAFAKGQRPLAGSTSRR